MKTCHAYLCLLLQLWKIIYWYLLAVSGAAWTPSHRTPSDAWCQRDFGLWQTLSGGVANKCLGRHEVPSMCEVRTESYLRQLSNKIRSGEGDFRSEAFALCWYHDSEKATDLYTHLTTNPKRDSTGWLLSSINQRLQKWGLGKSKMVVSDFVRPGIQSRICQLATVASSSFPAG